MWHPDEGTIHAWIEGQLSADEVGRVASHVENCAECKTTVAEARGMIAGASRVVGFLDDGVGTATAKGDLEKRRQKTTSRVDFKGRWMVMGIAATVLIGVASMFVLRAKPGVDEARRLIDGSPGKAQTSVAIPAAPRDTTATRGAVGGLTRGVAHQAANLAQSKAASESVTKAAALSATAPSAVAAAPALAGPERPAAVPAPGPAAAGRGGAGMGGASVSAPRAAAMSPMINPARAQDRANFGPARQASAALTTLGSPTGCYQLLPSAEPNEAIAHFPLLPRRFELSTVTTDSGRVPQRVVSDADSRSDVSGLTWTPRPEGFVVTAPAGSLMASVVTGLGTLHDSTGTQPVRIARTVCR